MDHLIDLKLPSPVNKLETHITKKKGINLYIKRDDEIHPMVSGNKWRKLKYNLAKIKSDKNDCVITFGGAFSNHIHALAAACHEMNQTCAAIIRGELDLNNPTLRYCAESGMQLFSVSREAYKLKESSDIVKDIIQQYVNPVILPEGGSNSLALYGVAEVIDEIKMADIPQPDYIILAAGTGGTSAGLLTSDLLDANIWAVSSLKSDHLYDEILTLANRKNAEKLKVLTDYHFGGYAKWNQQLLDFIHDFEDETNVPLDHVYNGKAMYALMDQISQNVFAEGTNIVYLHTGGLQGKEGLKYMLDQSR